MSGNFTFQIASDVDREMVFCEIYYDDSIVAEISHNESSLTLNIFAPDGEEWWSFPLKDFQQALIKAEKLLTE